MKRLLLSSLTACLSVPMFVFSACGTGEENVVSPIPVDHVSEGAPKEVLGKKGWPLNGYVQNFSPFCVTVWYADKDDGSDATCRLMGPFKISDRFNDDIDFIQDPLLGVWYKIFANNITVDLAGLLSSSPGPLVPAWPLFPTPVCKYIVHDGC